MNTADNHISRRNFLNSASLLTAGLVLSSRSIWAANSGLTEVSPVTAIIQAAAKSPVTVQKLRNSISLLEGSGGNICVLTGPEGKLLVDAGIDVSKQKITRVLASLSDKPLKHLINTHWHFDHASGNAWMHEAGAAIIAHTNTKKRLMQTLRVDDWSYTFKPAPAEALPTTVFEQKHSLQFNGESIHLTHYAPAHTDSDLAVYFEQADILYVADTWWNGYYSFIDYSSGGQLEGMLAAATANLERVTDKTIIVPGHGPIGNKAQLRQYRDMLFDVKQKVQALKQQGLSLPEAVARKPTQAYDAKWGNFVINGDFFTNLVYRGV